MIIKDRIRKLEIINESLENLKAECNSQLLRSNEASKKLSKIIEEIGSSLEKDSKAYKIFDRLKRERALWWKETITGYVHTGDCEHFEYWLNAIETILIELDPTFSDKKDLTNFYFKENEKFKAQQFFVRLIKQATNSLFILDSYLDDEIFEYIENVEESIQIKLITANKKAIFKKLYKSFKEIRPNIEAREFSDCHDRFIMIDKRDIWHIGNSINGFGKKAFRISKIEEPKELSKLITDLERFWQQSKPL